MGAVIKLRGRVARNWLMAALMKLSLGYLILNFVILVHSSFSSSYWHYFGIGFMDVTLLFFFPGSLSNRSMTLTPLYSFLSVNS